MKYAVIAIDDNTAKIIDVKHHREEVMNLVRDIEPEIEKLQKEALMKMFLYIKCFYDDYVKVNEFDTTSSHITGIGSIGEYVDGIVIRRNKITVSFHPYSHPDLVAFMEGDDVRIPCTYPQSVCALMEDWNEIKSSLRQKIDRCYEERKLRFSDELNEKLRQLKIAREFQV